MGESLADGERHSSSICHDGVFIAISTFPCSVKEVQNKHYPLGYTTYLDRIISISRKEDPESHFMHFQFFWDGESYWVQFTLFPNKKLLRFTPLYHMPVDLLTEQDKTKLGLD